MANEKGRQRQRGRAGSAPYLHVEEGGAVAGPLLHQRHVLDHGLLLGHRLQLPPLVQQAGAGRGDLLSHPGLQHVLLLQPLPADGAAAETAPERALQEAGALPLPTPLGPRRGERPRGLADAGPKPTHGVHLAHLRHRGLRAEVPEQVLEAQGAQELEGLLGRGVLAPDDGLVRLKGEGAEGSLFEGGHIVLFFPPSKVSLHQS